MSINVWDFTSVPVKVSVQPFGAVLAIEAEQCVVNAAIKWLGDWYKDKESKRIKSSDGVIIFNDCLLACASWKVRGGSRWCNVCC